MRRIATILSALAVIIVATLAFYAAEHQLSSALLHASIRPEMRAALERSMADQKRLRALDPQREAEYKANYEEARRLAARLDVLRIGRANLLRRYELILAAVFFTLLVLAGMVSWLRHLKRERRLIAIKGGLDALSRGETDVRLGDATRDVVGRIARMIEQTAAVVSRQHRRIESLQHLSAWQEAARRHAHEIRTPVTAARLEVERLASMIPDSTAVQQAKASALEELDRLGRYTSEFSSFARLSMPARRVDSVADAIREFCRAFEGAWPNLKLEVEGDALAMAAIDRDLLRQVCVNLCENTSLAVDASGQVRFTILRDGARIVVDVSDNGGGIDPAVRPRLFQPYATTRKIGEGMGLGLAISRKIMLDHDGDLELLRSSAAGTTFRMTLPAGEEPS